MGNTPDDKSLKTLEVEEGSIEPSASDIEKIEGAEANFIESVSGGKHKKYERFVLAILGVIPWVGSILSATLSATANLAGEIDQEKNDELLRLWVKEHQEKIKELGLTIQEILSRLDGFGEEIQERIQSPQYLSLVRKAFSSWDQAESEEKRQMLKKLIINSGAIKLCPDDLIRLFINWINQYHEAHFAVIKEIYRNPGITRAQIWDNIHGERPREDSSEADLFKLLVSDLSIGRVVRQERETNAYGQFIKRGSHGSRGSSGVMESAFEETKPYVLTELGKKFVHYVMEDVVPQIEEGATESSPN